VTAPATYHYRVVDVFTREKFKGNPLAVFLDSEGLSTEQMQAIAREMNLSETVFLCPATRPECGARLRIFTPAREMEFAGHPTIGASYVLLSEGLVQPEGGMFAVEENIGAIRIRVDDGTPPLFWLTTPPICDGRTIPKRLAAALLELTEQDLAEPQPQVLDAGNPTLFIPLRDREAVDRAAFCGTAWRDVEGALGKPMCVFLFAPTAGGAYSRMFAPDYGVAEDPATGSSTGPLAAYMMRHGLVPFAAGSRFVSEQGTRMGRRSLLHVAIDGDHGKDGIRVGGEVTPVLEGRLRL
jgi:trans-2,3-dihydro-3-hydroxyanthranilate isomerase